MNWDAIAAAGQVLGSVAVLITLAYLARQVRHAKELIVHNGQTARAAAALQLMTSISDSPSLAPILAKVGGWRWAEFGLDDPADNIRFTAWCYAWWRTEEMNFRTYSAVQLATQARLITRWLEAWGDAFWPTNRALFDADFVAVVDRLYAAVMASKGHANL